MTNIPSNSTPLPQQKQNTSTHIMNVQELQSKDKTKYTPENWHDRFSYLVIMSLAISGLLVALSFIDSVSFLIYLTPLPPIVFTAIWLVKRLLHGKNIEPIK